MQQPPDPTDKQLRGRGPLRDASPNGRGSARLARALQCSLAGLRAAYENERAFRQEIALAVLLMPLAVALPLSAIERFLLVGSVLLVLIVELLNTAIEMALDRVSLEQHPLTAAAKDIGSAAVLLSLVVLVIAWASIAGPVIAGLMISCCK